MTTEIFFSTNQLGVITDEQFQLMLDRFQLGTLISAEKTSKGVGNQTMFVSSSKGCFVMKGNPLFVGQFIEEKYYVDHLRENTQLPLPVPYLVDDSQDILDWSYAIMPRLEGIHMNEPEFRAGLSGAEKEEIAEAIAKSLSEMHSWKVDEYGEFDPKNQEIRPFEGSYKSWLYSRIRFWLEDAKRYSVITSADVDWVEEILHASEEVFDKLCAPSFVMGDFKADNILVAYDTARREWKVSGIFDFTTGYFADGAADLPKMVIMYMDQGDEGAAKQFLEVYLQCSGVRPNFEERFRVHMLHQRILDWGCAKAINDVPWDEEIPFSEWAQKYVNAAADLLR